MQVVIRCAPCCMLYAVEGRLCSLEVPEVQVVQQGEGWAPFAGDAGGAAGWRVGSVCAGNAGGDTMRATLYAGGCGG